jgi:hypothetical protein
MQYPADEETVLVLLERVNEAQRLAARELREIQSQDPRKKKRKRAQMAAMETAGMVVMTTEIMEMRIRLLRMS